MSPNLQTFGVFYPSLYWTHNLKLKTVEDNLHASDKRLVRWLPNHPLWSFLCLQGFSFFIYKIKIGLLLGPAINLAKTFSSTNINKEDQNQFAFIWAGEQYIPTVLFQDHVPEISPVLCHNIVQRGLMALTLHRTSWALSTDWTWWAESGKSFRICSKIYICQREQATPCEDSNTLHISQVFGCSGRIMPGHPL